MHRILDGPIAGKTRLWMGKPMGGLVNWVYMGQCQRPGGKHRMSQRIEAKREKPTPQHGINSRSGGRITVPAEQPGRANKLAGGFQKPVVTDRRQAVRIAHSTEVSVRRLSSRPLTEAQSIDVSRTGIKLSTPQPLSVGSALQLVFTLPGTEEPTSIRGIVVWSKPSQQMFEAGIMFASEAQKTQPTQSGISKQVGFFLKPGA